MTNKNIVHINHFNFSLFFDLILLKPYRKNKKKKLFNFSRKKKHNIWIQVCFLNLILCHIIIILLLI